MPRPYRGSKRFVAFSFTFSDIWARVFEQSLARGLLRAQTIVLICRSTASRNGATCSRHLVGSFFRKLIRQTTRLSTVLKRPSKLSNRICSLIACQIMGWGSCKCTGKTTAANKKIYTFSCLNALACQSARSQPLKITKFWTCETYQTFLRRLGLTDW